MREYGIMSFVETEKATSLQGFFISPDVAQLYTFGVRAPVFTFAQRGNPACCFSVSTTKGGVKAGVFSFQPERTLKMKIYLAGGHFWEGKHNWRFDLVEGLSKYREP